jgi:hypothetical protein
MRGAALKTKKPDRRRAVPHYSREFRGRVDVKTF